MSDPQDPPVEESPLAPQPLPTKREIYVQLERELLATIASKQKLLQCVQAWLNSGQTDLFTVPLETIEAGIEEHKTAAEGHDGQVAELLATQTEG